MSAGLHTHVGGSITHYNIIKKFIITTFSLITICSKPRQPFIQNLAGYLQIIFYLTRLHMHCIFYYVTVCFIPRQIYRNETLYCCPKHSLYNIYFIKWSLDVSLISIIVTSEGSKQRNFIVLYFQCLHVIPGRLISKIN